MADLTEKGRRIYADDGSGVEQPKGYLTSEDFEAGDSEESHGQKQKIGIWHYRLRGLECDDHPQYGQLADAESASGVWNFSSGLTVSGIPVDIGGAGGVSDHGALAGLGDDDHPQYLKNAVEDTTPELGGNLDALGNDITNVDSLSANSGSFGSTLTVSGVPVATVGGGGGVLGPVVLANLWPSQVIPTATETKVIFNNRQIERDTDGTNVSGVQWDDVNYRFTPTVSGLYAINSTLRWTTDLPATTTSRVSIFKNGVLYLRGPATGGGNGYGVEVTCFAEANGTTDYFEAYVIHSKGSNATLKGGGSDTFFNATRL